MSFVFSLGALLSGQSLKHSVQTGLSLAQIGEFSFIIASLGVSLKVTSSFLYPIAVAASTLTTFTTPFLVKSSGSVFGFIEKHLPERWLKNLNRYSSSSQQLSAYSEWKQLLHGYIINSIIHSVLIVALIYLSRGFIQPFVAGIFSNDLVGTITSIIFTLLLMIPFIWALAIKRIEKQAYSNLWLNKKINRGPLIAIELARIGLAVLHVGILINLYFSLSVAFLVAVLSMGIAITLFNKKLQSFYERLEHRFLSNLNERQLQKVVRHEITPWDAHLATFDVPKEFILAGKQLQDIKLREKYGVNIALIERGKLSIISPDRYERLYPGDKLSIIGTDEQLGKIRVIFENQIQDLTESDVQQDEITLQNFTVIKDSRLYNQTIRKSGIREEAKALVVGLEKNGQRILNPDSTIQLHEGDIVWIVGVKQKIVDFLGHKFNK
jgi:CPA2 family monovalent cation:H+ antiporter-2